MRADHVRKGPMRQGVWADRALNAFAGLVASTALFGMMWLTLADILSRKFGHTSIRGATEVTEIMLVAVIFAALPLVSWRSEHVMLDTLDQWLGERGLAIRRVLVHIACACAFAVLAYLMFVRGLRLIGDGDTTSHLKMPIAPVAMAMALCLGLAAAAHLLLIFVEPPPVDGASAEAL